MVTDAHTAVIGILSAMDKLFQAIPAIPGSPFDKLKKGVHNALGSVQKDFDTTKEKWRQTDAALSKKAATAKVKADITDLTAKLKTAKAKLKDPTLTKKQRAKVGADIKELTAKLKAAKQKLDAIKHGKTIAKLHGDAKDLQAKITSMKAKLKTVHNSKTRAKIKGDIKDAQAKLAQIKAQLAALNGKTATVYVKTVRRNITRHIDINVPTSNASDGSWSGSLGGGGMSRTGGPTPVNVQAPIVNTTVQLDSQVIRTVARSTVLDENRRAAYRARVGARR
jgi:predicted  nucleic acid-binding Zn-ribbon protein